jgi:hypothetical protein
MARTGCRVRDAWLREMCGDGDRLNVTKWSDRGLRRAKPRPATDAAVAKVRSVTPTRMSRMGADGAVLFGLIISAQHSGIRAVQGALRQRTSVMGIMIPEGSYGGRRDLCCLLSCMRLPPSSAMHAQAAPITVHAAHRARRDGG